MALLGLCDPHVHTTFSDGRHTPQQVVDVASRLQGLDTIAITDHDCIDGATLAIRYIESSGSGLHVIVGEEVTTLDGHVVGLFLRELVRRGMSARDTIQAIHEQGGLAIAVHPFRHPGKEGVAALACSEPFDAVEILNGAPTPRARAANRNAARLQLKGKARTGGSDAHIKEMIGACSTGYPGCGPRDFREAILHAQTWPVRRRTSLSPYLRYAGLKVARHPSALRELWPL